MQHFALKSNFIFNTLSVIVFLLLRYSTQLLIKIMSFLYIQYRKCQIYQKFYFYFYITTLICSIFNTTSLAASNKLTLNLLELNSKFTYLYQNQ